MKRSLLLLVVCMTASLLCAQTDYTVVSLPQSTPRLTAVDPYANPANPTDVLKPARPYWYSVDQRGLTILRIGDNRLIYTVPWPAVMPLAQPSGEFTDIPMPPGGWEPLSMVVSYPTEEALASNSETPPTFVYVVMARSGYQWASNLTAPPIGQDPNLRDMIVPATSPDTESGLLVAVDVSDPTFTLGPPAIGAALLGHNPGQPAFDPAMDQVYVPNMPTMSLPTSATVPSDLTSFVSVISALAPPEPAGGDAGEGETGGSTISITVLCGPEHPEEGILVGVPQAWACIAEGGEGPFTWEFTNLPSWLHAHPDKITNVLDGILYGTPPAVGSYTFTAHVMDASTDPASEGTAVVTLNVMDGIEYEYGELEWEVGIPAAVAIEGTGSCELAPNTLPGASPTTLVPAWVDVVQIPGRPNVVPGYTDVEQTIGCVVMGTPPISGEFYEFAMPNLRFARPFESEAIVLSGIVAGPYIFDPLPQGTGLSGLAWHQIDKIHDPSTEADLLNREFIGVEPFTGQLYRILAPIMALEVEPPTETAYVPVPPPEVSAELDEIETEGLPLLDTLLASRPDIQQVLVQNPNLKVMFGNLAVEVDRDIFVAVPQLVDTATGAIIPIGGSAITDGALLKVNSVGATAISLPGVQSNYLALNSDLAPAIPGVEKGQKDNGLLWTTGWSTGKAAVVDTAAAAYSQILPFIGAISLGGVSINPATGAAYLAGTSTQSVTITGPSNPLDGGPMILSASSTTFTAGSTGYFVVSAAGTPKPSLAYVGTLPGGLSFLDNGNGTAVLSGTATAGNYGLTITAVNSKGATSQKFTLNVSTENLPLALLTESLPTGATSVPYFFQMEVVGGKPPYLWSVVDRNNFPKGLNISELGLISGKPNQSGTFTFTIKVTDSALTSATRKFVVPVSLSFTDVPSGVAKISLQAGKSINGITVNPVTNKAYVITEVEPDQKAVLVLDNNVLNAQSSPKKLNLPLGSTTHPPKVVPIANENEYITVDTARNLIYIATKFGAESDELPDDEGGGETDPGGTEAPEMAPVTSANPVTVGMGTFTVIDGKTDTVLATWYFKPGIEPEGVAVDIVNSVVYVGAKAPEPPDTANCEWGTQVPDAATGEVECWTAGSIYAFFIVPTADQDHIVNFLKEIPAGDDPESVVFVNGMVYAANEDDGTVTVAKAVTPGACEGGVCGGELQTATPLPPTAENVAAGAFPYSLGVFYPKGPNPLACIDNKFEADKMAAGGGSVFITDDRSRVAKITGTTVVNSIEVSGATQCLEIPNSDGGGANSANNIAFMKSGGKQYLYVVSEQNTLAVYDPETMVLKSTITVPDAQHIDGIGVDGSAGRIWLTDESLQAVFVLQGSCAVGNGPCTK